MAVVKSRVDHAIRCDECGIESEPQGSLTQACREAREDGWEVGLPDLCPEDSEKRDRENDARLAAMIERMETDGTFDRIRKMFT